jgi:putative hydrolase of the HAD superfamily
VFRRHGIDASRFLMVGNSLKSDILPVLALGGAGAYVPYRITWAAEQVEDAELPQAEGRFFRLNSLRELAGVVELLQPVNRR